MKQKKEKKELQRKENENRLRMFKDGIALISSKKKNNQLTVTDNVTNLTILRTGGAGDNCGILFTKATKWRITIIDACSANGLMIGVAPQNFNENASQHSACGFYVHTGSTTKYGQGGVSNQAFQTVGITKSDTNGTVFILEYSNGELKFNINGTDCGKAYTGIPTDLFPAISYIYNVNAKFQIEVLE